MLKFTTHIKLGLSTMILASTTAFAATVEVNGFIGLDSNIIAKFDRGNATEGNPSDQSQTIKNIGKNTASFQSYLFHLDPTIIINDAATIKGEISTNYGRGGLLGESTKSAKNDSLFGPTFLLSTPVKDNNNNNNNNNNTLTINQLYAELYTDLGTVQLGRFAQHWGLGAVNHAGANPWNRYVSAKDGIAVKAKIGHFKITPWWAKLGSVGSLTSSGSKKEYGLSLLYDNPERDLMVGVAYTNRQAKNSGVDVVNEPSLVAHAVEDSKASIFSLYGKKTYKKFTFATEIPIVSGQFYNLYDGAGKTSYRAFALLFEVDYKHSSKWRFGTKFGHVGGDKGDRDRFSAFYVNPNYKIAHLLCNYNLAAMGDTDNRNSIWDAYLTNANYLRLEGSYQTDKWEYTGAIIVALANEVAQEGKTAFNHEKNIRFDAAANQKKNYGTEIDLDLTYHWNQEINVGGSIGYLITGDYYAFTNTPDPAKVQNSYLIQAQIGMNF